MTIARHPLLRAVAGAACAALVGCAGGTSSEDDDDAAPLVRPSDTGTASGANAGDGAPPPDPGSGTARYEGTWRTACLGVAEGLLSSLGDRRRDTFTYDGERAAFFTDYFADAGCAVANGNSVELVGTLAFGGPIIEDVFGVEATLITFTSEVSRLNGTELSEDAVPAPFNDLIYRAAGGVTFGEASRTDPDTGAPSALAVLRSYRYIGPADPLRLD